LATFASAQQINACAGLMHFKSPRLEITKAAPIAAGTTEQNPYGQGPVLRFAPIAESRV
jgi:hypothetical protein